MSAWRALWWSQLQSGIVQGQMLGDLDVNGNEITTTEVDGDIVLRPDGTGAVVIYGDLNVSGSVTTTLSETVLIEDNIVVLNSGHTGPPTLDAGVSVERGDETDASFIWDETLEQWVAGLAGSEAAVMLAGDNISLLTNDAGYVTNPMEADLDVNDFEIVGKAAASPTSAGNDVVMRGSDSGATSGAGGDAWLKGGEALGGADPGGNIYLEPGKGDGTAPTLPTPTGTVTPTEWWFVDANSTPGYVGLVAPDDVSAGTTGDGNNTVWTLPEGDGSSNQVWVTDGNGILSWVSVSSLETDPVFSVSAASGISVGDISNWDEAHGWGNHGTVGYLTTEANDLSAAVVWPTAKHASATANIVIQPADVTSGTGNFFSASGGDGSAGDADGGQGQVAGGDPHGTGTGGLALLQGGGTTNTASIGGIARVSGGTTGSGTAGDVEIRAGWGLQAGGTPANVLIRPGFNAADVTMGYVELEAPSGSTSAPELRFDEAQTNGPAYFRIKAADDMSGGVRLWTLPSAAPTAGQAIISTDVNGTLGYGSFLTNPATANLDMETYDIEYADGETFQIKPTNALVAGSAGTAELLGQGSSTGSGGLARAQGGDTSADGFEAGGAWIKGGEGTHATGGYGGRAYAQGGDGSAAGGHVHLDPGLDTTDESSNGAVWIGNNQTGATKAAPLRFNEARVNGAVYFQIQAAADMGATTRQWTLPSTAPTAGQVIYSTDTSGTLAYKTVLENPATANLDMAGYNINTATSSALGIGIQPGIEQAANSGAASATMEGGDVGASATVATQGGSGIVRGGDITRTGATLFTGGLAIVSGGNATAGTNGHGGESRIQGGDGSVQGGNVELQPGKDTTDDNSPGVIEYKGPAASDHGAKHRHYEGVNAVGTNYIQIDTPDALGRSESFNLDHQVIRLTTGTHTVQPYHEKIVVDASGGNVTLNLHDATWERMKDVSIKRIDSSANTVTIALVEATDDLEGTTNGTISMPTQYQSLTLMAEAGNTAWWIF